MPFEKVKSYALKKLRWFRHDHQDRVDLEGFIILKSSVNNYHVVFNRPVPWSKNTHIVGWLALRNRSKKVGGFLIM
jgi:hypothetical protein